MKTTTSVLVSMALGAALLVGCTSSSDQGAPKPEAETTQTSSATVPKTTGTIALTVDHPDRCDPIADGCLLPFPSDFYTVADPTTPTGRRVHLAKDSLPANVDGVHIDPTHWNELDGFSPAAAVLVQIPDIDLTASGAAPVTDPAASLDPDAPVILLDATTGKRLSYWTELDAAAEQGAVPTMYVRPTQILPEGHRIVVAMRDLKTTAGATVKPTPTFRAYRDRLASDVATVEARRPAMERVFADLAAAKVDRADLTMAWDFTVASEEALSGRLLHIRDDAVRRLDGKAPAFEVTSSVPSDRTGIAREVTGTYQVPSYLSGKGEPGSSFVLDAKGLPTHTGTYTATFRCLVPTSATAAEPAAAGLYGHGLLGTSEQVGAAAEVAAQGNRVFCATDLIGMAEEDLPNAAQIVSELSNFNTLADRLQQGHLNTLVLGRLMIRPDGLGSDPAFQDHGTPIVTDHLVYYGLSQGGIMGGATTAVAQDWTYAVLGVPAMNYGLLLDRSVDFDQFRAVLNPSYPKAADRAVGLQLIQMLWDRGEASGYIQHLTTKPYEKTPKHRVLLQMAFGDHQVANIGTEAEARSIGARVVQPALAKGRSAETPPFWGIEAVPSYPYAGSALVMFDSGAERPPVANVPPRAGEDPHSDPRADPAAIRQIVRFLSTGQVVDVCHAKPCTAAPRD